MGREEEWGRRMEEGVGRGIDEGWGKEGGEGKKEEYRGEMEGE